ncbi:MAG: hypothetical protein E6X23_17760 [Mixta calida]|uniref:tyrosine-type recombinase/integrase n=1 Tax=Mixta calida TaxID=665913 RepID=UPI002913FCDD|nr:hypothetical protein [Mixta calida]MDU4943356.1 hypothetical protein [Mixta calida]
MPAATGIHLIYFTVHRGGKRAGPVLLHALTSAFAEARDLSGLQLGPHQLSFHEIRSLSDWLYETENGKEFAHRLLGHKPAKITAKYLDSRDDRYARIALPEKKTGY